MARRLTGEPLAWITGTTTFCGLTVRVDEGVYVPRPQTEVLARRAAERLPPDGTAIDLCTGTGAIALALARARPGARVLAADLDPKAVATARGNGVDAHEGDLFAALPEHPPADVVVAVVPYVPTAELRLLHRDTLTFESTLHYDGGPQGTALLERVITGAPRHLRAGGALIVELGGDQATRVAPVLEARGFTGATELRDEEGDLRGLEATNTLTERK